MLLAYANPDTHYSTGFKIISVDTGPQASARYGCALTRRDVIMDTRTRKIGG
jgi:hypothetical protein